MPTPPSRLPQKVQNALALIDYVVLAYDRLHFWLDHPLPLIPSTLWKDRRVSIIQNSQRYHPVWQTKIELLQPDADLLRACIGMAGKRYRILPNYVEIKLDLLTRTSDAFFSQMVPFLILFATILFMAQDAFRRLAKQKSESPQKPAFWAAN